jgi:hypothetical protein
MRVVIDVERPAFRRPMLFVHMFVLFKKFLAVLFGHFFEAVVALKDIHFVVQFEQKTRFDVPDNTTSDLRQALSDVKVFKFRWVFKLCDQFLNKVSHYHS